MVQLASLAFANSYVLSLLKSCPAPILNCHACPLAVMACPIGSLQHFIGQRRFPFALVGFFTVIGALVGRMACGWACPFGFLQDVLFKIRLGRKKLQEKAGIGAWKAARYPIFVGLVLIGAFATGEPLFCKLCPAGGLEAGLPLVAIDPSIRAMAGPLFIVKMAIVLVFIVTAILIKRPFCRFICPLGTIYSPFNKVSHVQLQVDKELCNRCGACRAACPVNIDPYLDANSKDCIRCLECTSCPAIRVKYGASAE
ncbi:MAG: 4Fe-4S binding protein [Firmicutes bacterium]|nr:4Fe-4S binding protein [Bacillota bacterium]